MKHILFKENSSNSYSICILLKPLSFSKPELIYNYINPLNNLGVKEEDIIAFDLDINPNGKCTAKGIKTYLTNLLPALNSLNVTTVLCCNGDYFKALTGCKPSTSHGYIKPCKIKGFEHLNIILSIDHRALLYDITIQDKLDTSLTTLVNHINSNHIDIGTNVIHSAKYLNTSLEVATQLNKLHTYPKLTCDIETLSLLFYIAGLETISFAWDKHNGISFPVDKDQTLKYSTEVRNLLKEFFTSYKGKIIWHNAGYDLKVLCFELYMKTISDYKGQLEGSEILTKTVEDTKIITYLATNTTAGNVLDLKTLSHEYMGNYGIDVTNTLEIPLKELLVYNLRDALATWYVYDKYYPIMVKDSQKDIYETTFKPSIKTILNIELTGMPICPIQVQHTKKALEDLQLKALHVLNSFTEIKIVEKLITNTAYEKDYKDRKAKAVKPENIKYKKDFKTISFNINSSKHLIALLYETLKFPIIDTTNTGLPATGAKTLEKLINHTSIIKHKELLNSIIEYTKVTKILTTFIPAFENALNTGDGFRLYGNFNICGTVSGRLSSSNVNLQNLPSNSTYGKLVKSCFISTDKWVYAGADFNSLESVINALLTKDPNKLRPLIENIDSHCWNAYGYYPDKFKDIPNTKEGINSIKTLFPDVRQNSKPITFAAQYGGTYRTYMNSSGMSEIEAKAIDKNYTKLYKVSLDWTQNIIKQATYTGYVTTAFGLRIRTPILSQTVYTSSMGNAAESEARTVGNAVGGQSYGQLNTKAATRFMEEVYKSKYKYDIKCCALIHDACYILFKNSVNITKWVNDNLIKAMEWNELPELQHDQVGLHSELDIFYPSWATPITLKNNISINDIYKTCQKEK